MAANSQDQSSRWDDVRIFLAAHRMKSLGAAATRLGLDTSTVSRRLTAFEESLGTRLFERTREGIVPTHAAESLVPAAEAMEAAHARLTRDASSVEAEAEGTVRISAAPGIADTFVAPSLVRLRKQHPKITVELDVSTTARDLTRHEADIALRSLKPQGAELVITKVATAPWLGAAHPALAKELGKLESWADAPWITWDRDLAGFPPARWVATHAAKAPVALRTSHFSSQLVAARTGLGIVLVPKPYLAPHELVPVRYDAVLAPSADAWPSDDLWLVGHRALRDVPRIAVVWEFLANEMRRITGG